ncbi:MAG: DUF4426 domain-containing protein [Pseudomonadota bacterium]
MPMPNRALLTRPYVIWLLLASLTATTQAQEESVVRAGDVEMHCSAWRTSELTPDAAREFNVVPSPDRGVLTITLVRHLGPGRTRAEAGQVNAGALATPAPAGAGPGSLRSSVTHLLSIPVREVRRDNGLYYLGEYRIAPSENLRFLVNATVGDKVLTADFQSRFTQE